MLRRNEVAKAVVPLVLKDEVIGLVETGENREGRTVTAAQIATAESICQLVALAVHDAEAIEAQKVQARQMASLLESSRASPPRRARKRPCRSSRGRRPNSSV